MQRRLIPTIVGHEWRARGHCNACKTRGCATLRSRSEHASGLCHLTPHLPSHSLVLELLPEARPTPTALVGEVSLHEDEPDWQELVSKTETFHQGGENLPPRWRKPSTAVEPCKTWDSTEVEACLHLGGSFPPPRWQSCASVPIWAKTVLEQKLNLPPWWKVVFWMRFATVP